MTTRTTSTARVTTSRKRLHAAAFAALLAIAALGLAACSPSNPTTSAQSASTAAQPTESAAAAATAGAGSSTAAITQAAPPSNTTAPATKLKITDTVVGKGPEAKAGDVVSVEYTGWLTDGTKFDSSVGKPAFQFTLGSGQVIEGWDKGVAGMKVGGTRILVIPPSLGYGAQGAGGVIPPNATLKFEVKLLSVGGQ